jgi:hypothetical protein
MGSYGGISGGPMRCTPVFSESPRTSRRQHRLPEPLEDRWHPLQSLAGGVHLSEKGLDRSDNALLLGERRYRERQLGKGFVADAG